MVTLAFATIFPLLVIYAAFSDLFTMTIPNRISLILVAGFAGCAVITGLPLQQFLTHAGAGLAVLAVGFTLFALGWIGGGDAKFASAIALWLGLGHVLDFLLVASIFGGGLTLAILILRSRPLPAFALSWGWLSHLHHPKTGVPYGIALSAAALAVYPETFLWQAAI
jgi:prepilin peptidase CpaA